MSTKTTNYELVKPDYGEAEDVKVVNDNMDIIDGAMKDIADSIGTLPSGETVQDQIDAINGNIGTLPDDKTVQDEIDDIEDLIGAIPEGETVVSQIATKLNKPSTDGTLDQILRTNADGTTRWDDAATSTEIGNAVSDWLGDNVPTGTTVVVDRSLTIQDAAADSKTTGDKIGDLKSAYTALENTLVSLDLIPNVPDCYLLGRGSVDSSGKITENQYSNYDIYIVSVDGIDSIDVTNITVYLYYINVPTWDSTAQDNQRHITSDNPVTISIPSGIKYVAVRTAHGTAPTVSLTHPTKLVGEKVDDLEGEVNNVSETVQDVVEESIQEIDNITGDGTVTNDYFMTRDGNDDGPFSGVWRYITYAVSEGEAYRISAYAGQDARLWILKDSSNAVVSYSDDGSAVGLKTEIVIIPNGVVSLIVNARTIDTTETNAINVLSVMISNKIKPSAIKDNILGGKILCCAGDSITAGADMDAMGITQISDITVYQSNASGVFSPVTKDFRKTWGYQIAERNGMVFYNAGVSGSTMQGIAEKNGFSLANGRYTKLPDNIDYLLIWFGWNDNAYGTLGTIADNTNESYYGGYNVVMPYLINKYPHTKIGLIVPFGSSEGHREAVRLLGNKWGVAVWDNYQGGTPLYYGKEDSVGVNPSVVTANRAKFQANGAHPNHYGHQQLADMIEAWLKGI